MWYGVISNKPSHLCVILHPLSRLVIKLSILSIGVQKAISRQTSLQVVWQNNASIF